MPVPSFELGENDGVHDYFVLRIRLGNAAMLAADDVADALSGIPDTTRPVQQLLDGGQLRDRNGNTVGAYGVEPAREQGVLA